MTEPKAIFTVPAILPLVRRLYANPGGGAGCCLHIVLDDGNITDDHVAYCVKLAEQKGHDDCEILGRILFCMSKTQRKKLSMHTVPEPQTVAPLTIHLDHLIPDLSGELEHLHSRAAGIQQHLNDPPRYFTGELADMTEHDILAWFQKGAYSGWAATEAEVSRFLVIAGSWDNSCDASAWVLLRDKETCELFEVSGSHCSCNGFEGQFNPRPTTLKYLLSKHFSATAIDTEDFQGWLRQQEWLRL